MSSVAPQMDIFTWVQPQGTLFPGEGADVPGAVAQQRKRLLCDGGEYQLALAALGQHLAGVRVDDLSDEVVLVDVHPSLGGALEGDTGAGQLGEPVDIIRLDAQGILNVLAHLLGPGFRTEYARLQGISSGLVPISFMVSPMWRPWRVQHRMVAFKSLMNMI